MIGGWWWIPFVLILAFVAFTVGALYWHVLKLMYPKEQK